MSVFCEGFNAFLLNEVFFFLIIFVEDILYFVVKLA